MKKYLLPLLLLAAPAFAAQQEITAVPASPANPSIGSLKTAINLRLADIDENFDEIYPIIAAGPVYVNASAPADTKVVWIDTDQDNAIKVRIGEVWTVVGTAGSAGDDLGSAAYTDVVALWTTCTGYLKSDGTCDTPSGSATYPSAAGVANWDGSAWGTSYTVGTAANNLVQLNASAQLPAVSADLLTITDTGTYFATDTVGAALQELGSELAEVTQITLDSSLYETGGVMGVTYPVTSEAYGSGWSADTDGAQRDDIYAVLHAGDTDDDGKADLLDAAVIVPDSGTLTFDESAADPNDADVQLSAADGVFKLAAVNGANNEDLTIDLDGAANTATIGSSTGLSMITTGSIPFTSAIKTTAIDTDTTLSGSAEYGSLTFNTAASTRTLTVTAGAGKSGCFRNAQGVAQILRVDAAAGDYVVKSTGARTSASGEYYGATADAKNQICWVSYDDTDIYVTSEVGTWTEQE